MATAIFLPPGYPRHPAEVAAPKAGGSWRGRLVGVVHVVHIALLVLRHLRSHAAPSALPQALMRRAAAPSCASQPTRHHPRPHLPVDIILEAVLICRVAPNGQLQDGPCKKPGKVVGWSRGTLSASLGHIAQGYPRRSGLILGRCLARAKRCPSGGGICVGKGCSLIPGSEPRCMALMLGPDPAAHGPG